MQKETKNWLSLLLLALIWGSSFILMKRGMVDKASGTSIFSEEQVASIRMLIAGVVLLPFGLKRIKEIVNLKTFFSLTIVGVFGNFLPAFFFTYAETELSSGYVGMLNSFVPIFTLLIGFAVFKHRLNKIQILGVLIGAVGIMWLILSGGDLEKGGSWTHVLACVGATLCYAISLNTIKNTLQHVKPLSVTALAFMITLLPAIVCNFIFGSVHTITVNQYALQGLGFISILAVVGTAIAVIVFNQLIANSTALFASSVTYFIPIIAVLFGLLDGESINVYQILAMAVILVGVYIANRLSIKKI